VTIFNRVVVTALLFAGCYCFSQGSDSSATNAKSVLGESTWVSPRAAGVAGGLCTMAEGMDAPYYNPAGIGGVHSSEKGGQKIVRYIGFPFFGGALGEDSAALRSEFLNTEGSAGGGPTTKAILDAYAGKRQYGRLSFVPGFVVSRFMLNYIYDYQVAAISRGEGTGLIETNQRVTSGAGFGFSAVNAKGSLYFGLYGASLKREVITADLPFSSIVDPTTRKETFREYKKSYNGLDGNVGIIWRIAENAKPSLAVVARHVGKTKFVSAEDSSEVQEVPQNLVVGFSVSPRLGKFGYVNFLIEADKLEEKDTAIEKKVRTGLELTLGSLFGNNSVFGLKGGYSSAGASYGIQANIGLLGVQASSFAEDIGIDNQKVIERRYVATISVNVAH